MRKESWPKLVTKDIEFLEAEDNYTWIYYKGGKKVLTSNTMKVWEIRLPDFLRIHKGFLVNPQSCKDWNFTDRTVKVGKDWIIDIARRRIGELKKLI